MSQPVENADTPNASDMEQDRVADRAHERGEHGGGFAGEAEATGPAGADPHGVPDGDGGHL